MVLQEIVLVHPLVRSLLILMVQHLVTHSNGLALTLQYSPLLGNSVSFSGLSAGTYTFQVTDSCSPINNQSLPINVYISSGTCVSIFSKTNTTCNEGNGSISAIIQQFYGNIFYELYEINDGLQQTLSPPFDVLSPLVTFTNLTPGTYYVVADDGGGCTGKNRKLYY